MKIKNKLLLLLAIFALIIPANVLALVDQVILGGENIGIEIDTEGVLIVGFYTINNNTNTKNLKLGDRIIKINNNKVNNINEMIKEIESSISKKDINLTIIRNNEEIETTLKLEYENNTYKTGIYVKDKIIGIGSIAYINPETKTYGALGHEIIESYSNTKVEVKTGKIYDSTVTGIKKSSKTKTGEKQAKINKDISYGNIDKNTITGIYGTYTGTLNMDNLISVAKKNEIHEGKAYIYTVLENNKKEKYEINIIKINQTSKTKNILFEITDQKLINKTNGIIKGMSGSPIIQNNKIIGAVTHAIQSKNNLGYGIFITTMLEEGEN